MKQIIKMFIAVVLLIAVLPVVFAGNVENNWFYAYGTNAPLTNVQGLAFTCTDATCRYVTGSAWFNGNSGASNLLSIEYPGTPSITQYAEYFFAQGYIPMGAVAEDYGTGGVYNYNVYFYKANNCHSPVDSFAITNSVYANEPLVINIPALVDSTVTSAFRKTTAPPYYTPSGFNDYYSALTNVILNVYNPNGTLAYTETKQVNLFADSQQEVTFTWTPTLAGNNYRATITTNVIDDQCASHTDQSAAKNFNVLPARPTNQCYTLLNNLEYNPKFPINGRSNVTFTYEKISNYVGANPDVKTGIPTSTTYTIRRGQSDASGAVVYSSAQQLPASSTTIFTEFSTQWLANVGIGWYTMYITGIGTSPLCNGLNNTGETVSAEFYVESPPMVNVFFDVYDNANGAKIQNAAVTFNGQTINTDANGMATFSNVPGTNTYAYTVTHAQYNTVTGSQYIGETDTTLHIPMIRINNNAPQFTSTPLTTACLNQAYSYDADAVDPEGDPVTFSLNGPAGMTINTANGVVSWTPTATGSYTALVTASDDHGASNTQQFTIAVRDCNANTAPVIMSAAVTNACLNQAYAYQVNAVDAQGDAIVYSLTTSPAGMIISAAGLVAWTPTAVGQYAVTVRATDGRDATLFNQQPFTLTVTDCSNMGPRIVSTPVTVAYDGQLYQYDVEAIDPEGDSITYTLDAASLARNMTINPTNGLIQWTPQPGDMALSPFTVTVTATSLGGSASQTYQITVSEESVRFYVSDMSVYVKLLTGDYVSPGDTMQLMFTMANEGRKDFENVQALAYVDDMQMRGVAGPFDLNSGDEVTKRVYLTVPNNAGKGTHYLRLIVNSNMGWREVYRDFKVR